MLDTTIFQKKLVHGMFIFIVFAVVATSTVLVMIFVQVSADIDDMQDTSVFVKHRSYLREELKK